MAVAMAHRHVAVEGFGALVQPLLGRGEESDVVLCCWQDVPRSSGAKPASRSIVPILGSSQSSLGKTRVTPSASGVGRMVSFNSVNFQASCVRILPRCLAPKSIAATL